jgi:hypothetical protein
MSTLHVITPIFNSARYKSRIRLYNEFADRVEQAGAQLWTVELALGDRPFEVTYDSNPYHLQLRSIHELWHKERMMNLMVARLPESARYIAFMDSDLNMMNPNWVDETIQQLQHYEVVQMFSESINLNPSHGFLNGPRIGWVEAYNKGMNLTHSNYGSMPHPGFAWAFNRSALDHLGGLLDQAILGSGDLHMARALLSNVNDSLPKGLSQGYREMLEIWADRAKKHIRKDVGVVPGLVAHYWHGKRVDRQYNERWKILEKYNYSPTIHLKKDWQGLDQFTDAANDGLMQDIRRYFIGRNEDSIDV